MFHGGKRSDILISPVFETMSFFISLWPSDALGWHRSESTLAQVMACGLTAPSHYLKQCWRIISEVFWLWHSPEGNFTGNAQNIYPWYEFENDLSKITATSPMGQGLELWINSTEVWCLTPEIHLITLLKKKHDWAPKKKNINTLIYLFMLLPSCTSAL